MMFLCIPNSPFLGCQMSKDMQALLERISTKPAVLPATYEPPKTSNSLKSLWSQVETRQWQKSMLEQIEGEILALYAEMREYYHYLNCEECLIELQLSVERYLGTRGPWCINYQIEECIPEFYPDCPKAEDYEIGYYSYSGEDTSSEDTIRFIKDRLTWAIKFTDKRFEAAFKLVPILENWSVSRGIPEVSWIDGMIDELAGNPTLFFGV